MELCLAQRKWSIHFLIERPFNHVKGWLARKKEWNVLMGASSVALKSKQAMGGWLWMVLYYCYHENIFLLWAELFLSCGGLNVQFTLCWDFWHCMATTREISCCKVFMWLYTIISSRCLSAPDVKCIFLFSSCKLPAFSTSVLSECAYPTVSIKYLHALEWSWSSWDSYRRGNKCRRVDGYRRGQGTECSDNAWWWNCRFLWSSPRLLVI